MYSRVNTRSGSYNPGGVVKLDQVPRWIDADPRISSVSRSDAAVFSNDRVVDPLTSFGGGSNRSSKFSVDHEVNQKLYIWRGPPWNLEVDAVVNSTNESLDEMHSSPGLHAAAGTGLAEECATLGGCRTGLAKITGAYDLPARRVIHTVGPRYALKYHTAAENALSHCYRACLELLIENDLESIAMGCIYTEVKGYPSGACCPCCYQDCETIPGETQGQNYSSCFCLSAATDIEIYRRLLPLYFPRDENEEELASMKLPADVGDENGETTLTERKIRISALPAGKYPEAITDDTLINHQSALMKRKDSLDALVDPVFMSMAKDPDLRRQEQWEKASQLQAGWNFSKWIGFTGLGGPQLSPVEEDSLHARYLARANVVNLTEVAEMKIIYRGGVDADGRPVLVIVGAHFLLRCLDLERFVLYIVKEFEPIIQRPYSIVYFHSAAALQIAPDLGWMKRMQQILGRKHRRNLHAIYVLHPTFGLKTTILALQLLVDQEVWKQVVYVERLLDLFRYVPREQLTIPDFVFQHDLEVNGEKALGIDSKPRHVIRNGQGSL